MYSEQTKKDAIITPLVDYKLNQFERSLTKLKINLNDCLQPSYSFKTKFEANFRATGFLIDVNGYLVTNAHVINNAKN